MLFLGFSSGLPFLLVFSTLTVWLRQAGIEEVGALPAGLEGELPEAQRLARERQFDETELIVLHSDYHCPMNTRPVNLPRSP